MESPNIIYLKSAYNFIKNTVSGVEGMGQQIKCWLHKQRTGVHLPGIHTPSLRTGETDRKISGACLLPSAAKLVSVFLPQKIRTRATEEDTWYWPLAPYPYPSAHRAPSTCVDKHVHTYSYDGKVHIGKFICWNTIHTPQSSPFKVGTIQEHLISSQSYTPLPSDTTLLVRIYVCANACEGQR